MHKMRIAIAGTGSIGRRHIDQLQILLSEVQWVFLRDHGKSDDYSNLLGAEVFTGLQSALSRDIDALIIATPSSKHADLIALGLAADLPMYIEKPVLTNRCQLQTLRQLLSVKETIPQTQVGCNLRFLPSLQRLKDLVGQGVIGRIVRASFDSGQWLPDWRPHQDYRKSYSADPDSGGGVLFDLIHEIDAAYWILGELIPLACAVENVPCLDIKSESVATALLRSHDGCLVQIGLDYIARSPLRRYQLVGEMGTLTWDLSSKSLTLATQNETSIVECGVDAFDVSSTYYLAMKSFCNSFRFHYPLVQPLDEGIAVSEISIALKEMAESKC